MDRRARMLGSIALADSTGLEIGALHSPLVRRHESQIRYVDYASTAVLRENFRHPGDPADIVEVDIVWGGRTLRECLDAPVDYILASHVIEHVPDLIGWLLELREALKPGKVLGLAIPDRRHTFDIRRDCPKNPTACTAFGNFINYKGEPLIPIGDGVPLLTPGGQIAGGFVGSQVVE